jgi:hypothetical protein
MKRSMPPKLERFPAAKQRRLDHLLEKNSEGTITNKEKERLKQLVEEAERLMVVNAQHMAAFSRGESGGASKDAIPVTVWVQPQHTGR